MSIREVLTFTKGSKKQCSWAYDILDEAFANLDNMENYIRKLDSYDAGHGETRPPHVPPISNAARTQNTLPK